MIKAYTAGRIFTGEELLTQHAIVVQNDLIRDVLPLSSLEAGIPIEDFNNGFIAPAFIDLQIYGAYEKLFAVYPEVDALNKLREYNAIGGAAYCLPTVATNSTAIFYQCIDAIKRYWDQGGKGILGLHLEGPWINPVKKGAHIETFIHSPQLTEVKELLEYGKDVIRMITLAPEVCSKEVIDLILSYNVVISAGHSNATYAEAKNGFKNGITTVTHLYNAMSPLQHREPGLAGAAMDDENVFASIIPDGHHVDFAALRIAKAVMRQRLFAITDAVTTTTRGGYQHYLSGDKYEASGILSGSALTMNQAFKNLITHGHMETGEALRMCSLYPAQVINKDNELGKIKKGYTPSLVILNDKMEVIRLIH